MKGKKLSFTTLTFIAMIAGAALGLAFGKTMCDYKFIGTIWLNCVKMIMVPLIFVIITLALGRQSNAKTLGRVSMGIVIYYFLTTVCASVIGITVASIIKPGVGMTMEGLAVTKVNSSSNITFVNFITSLFSNNMFGSFSKGSALQTMVIAALMGLALMSMKNQERKARIIQSLEGLNDLIYAYVGLIMKVAPIGVLFLIADFFGQYGTSIFGTMAKWIGSVWLALFCQIVLVYGICLKLFAGFGPFKYLKDTARLWSFTMATCASSAAVPISLDIAHNTYGVRDEVADFCIPLGAQINYDGATIMISTVLVLIAQMNGIETGFFYLMRMVLVASLVASSGGGVPGNSMVKLMVVTETLGLPTEFVGVIAGFYRLTEMGTSSTNSLGDLAGTICMDAMEKRIEKRAQKAA